MTDVDVRDPRSQLGSAALPPDELAAIVRTAVADPTAEITSWRVEQIDYPAGSPSTGALLRVTGTAAGCGDRSTGDRSTGDRRTDWSVFVKVLRSPALWPFLHAIPPALREDFLDSFPWRLEVDAFQGGLAQQLPPTLRLARLYRIVEIDANHVAIWMEDVKPCPAPWDVARFGRAAYALGQLAARRRPGAVLPFRPEAINAPPGAALRFYVQGRVQYGAVPALTSAETWQHPLLARAVATSGDAALQADLSAAAGRIPALLDAVEALAQTYAHGDASPQNLLVPADDPDVLVAIDWGFDTPQAIGFDLGQLLVGLAHAGELAVADLPAVHEMILPAYIAGVRAEGMEVDEEDVRYGYIASMALRSAFTALPLDELGGPHNHVAHAAVLAHWCSRVRLTRYLLDLLATLA